MNVPRRLRALLVVVALGVTGCASTIAGRPTVSSGAAVAPATGSSSPTTGPTTPSAGPTDDSGGPTTTSSQPSNGSSTEPQPPAREPDGAVGDDGIGDPYYPTAGNGGYEVSSYDVAIDYTPESNELIGTATIAATVTEDSTLGRFNLDLQPSMEVSSVEVGGEPASFEQDDAELVITPATGLEPDTDFTVTVSYSGEPGTVSGGTAGLGDGGWHRTKSGGAVAAGEPFSASSWYPVNEHPADTATFQLTVTVPDEWSVIANGVEFDGALPDPGDGKQSSRWTLDASIASYLTTLYIDKFTVTEDELDDGTPIVNAFAPGNDSDKKLATDTKKIIEVLSSYFGPYPFDAAGGIYTGEPIPFALETATRPVYADWVDTETIVHELAHQWYGDAVTVQRWSDICLNECFASYAPWLWFENTEKANLDEYWKSIMAGSPASDSYWSSPLVDMGAGNEFTMVYDRGPLAVHALRKEMGDKAFFQLLKEWPAKYSGRNATFDEWEEMASTIAGKDLGPFIDAWFRGTTKPAEKYLHPGGI